LRKLADWLERAVPHPSQNLAPARFKEPHDTHRASIGVPHPSQNLAVTRFSEPHFAQRISRLGVPQAALHRRSPTTRAPKTTTSTHAPAANNRRGSHCPHSSRHPGNTSAAPNSSVETASVPVEPGTKVASPEERLGMATWGTPAPSAGPVRVERSAACRAPRPRRRRRSARSFSRYLCRPSCCRDLFARWREATSACTLPRPR
jgi:hypothetical protein